MRLNCSLESKSTIRLAEVIPMSNHNIGFNEQTGKIIPYLSSKLSSDSPIILSQGYKTLSCSTQL